MKQICCLIKNTGSIELNLIETYSCLKNNLGKMKSYFLLFVLLSIPFILLGQTADPVLMKINGKPVYKSEFEYIYNKNNSNNSLDKKTLNEYVDLFVNFKLKVEEAKTQGIDTTKSFIDELTGYRSQLTKPYLTDAKVDEQLVQEAYNRMKVDVDVSHILVRVAQNALPADTMAAWNKIISIQKRLAKEDFSKVAKEVSEDESVKDNGGHIGWISAFQTVVPFEVMAYNTSVGATSKPVRTTFGYHIIKVNDRRISPGEILVAHIMRFTDAENKAKSKDAKTKIDSIYQRVLAGDDFGKLAKQFSEDKGSAVKNGELPWFGTGRMVPEFESAAFALKNIGDVSTPVQSAYGWHIIKLLDRKGIASFESLKPDLERRMKRDERADKGVKSFLNNLKTVYSLSVNKRSLDEFVDLLGSKTNLNDSAFKTKMARLNKPLFTFATKNYNQSDFAAYMEKNLVSAKLSATEIIAEKFDAFLSQELLAYEDSQLEKKYPDFRYLMQEYHDGILLFDVSNREVWEKASKDTEGLEKYFNENRADYIWEKPHFKGKIIYCKDKETFKDAQLIVKKNPIDSIDKYLNMRLNDTIQYVKVEKGLYILGENKAVDKFGFKVKNADFSPSKDYPYVFVVGKNLKTMPESYLDVRGLVTADYQEYLEKQWIVLLREKYPVEIYQDVLKTVKPN